jgi:tetratricopeptide (TPR) repeat protein
MSEESSHPSAEQRLAQLSAVEDLHVAGRFREAADLCARLIGGSPDFNPYHVLRGRALVMLGDAAGGIACFEKALSIKHGDPIALQLLAQCLLDTGRAEKAIPLLAQVFYDNQDYESASALVRAVLLMPEADLELLDKAVRFLFKDLFLKYPELRTTLTPCVMLTDWCSANGIDFDILEPGGIMKLADTDGNPLPLYDSPALKFATIPGGSVVAGEDMALTPSGEFLYPDDFKVLGPRRVPFGTPDLYMPHYWDLQHRRLLHTRGGREIFVDKDVLLLTGHQRHHFGHWLIDYLPRLRYWSRTRGRRPQLFISDNLPTAHRQTLAQFNVQSTDLFEARRGQEYRFRSVTVMHTADGHRPAPSTVKFLYSALATEQTPRSAGASGKRYFLERSQTINGRNIANQAEFQAVLDEFGFETVRRPELSIAEQNEKFSKAEIILTVFGSDMYTMLQTPPGTDLIILTFRDLDNILADIEPIPARYCAILGMRHHSITCELLQRPYQPPYNSDVVVDCAALRQTVAGITARREAETSRRSTDKPSQALP